MKLLTARSCCAYIQQVSKYDWRILQGGHCPVVMPPVAMSVWVIAMSSSSTSPIWQQHHIATDQSAILGL